VANTCRQTEASLQPLVVVFSYYTKGKKGKGKVHLYSATSRMCHLKGAVRRAWFPTLRFRSSISVSITVSVIRVRAAVP